MTRTTPIPPMTVPTPKRSDNPPTMTIGSNETIPITGLSTQ